MFLEDETCDDQDGHYPGRRIYLVCTMVRTEYSGNSDRILLGTTSKRSSKSRTRSNRQREPVSFHGVIGEKWERVLVTCFSTNLGPRPDFLYTQKNSNPGTSLQYQVVLVGVQRCRRSCPFITHGFSSKKQCIMTDTPTPPLSPPTRVGTLRVDTSVLVPCCWSFILTHPPASDLPILTFETSVLLGSHLGLRQGILDEPKPV